MVRVARNPRNQLARIVGKKKKKTNKSQTSHIAQVEKYAQLLFDPCNADYDIDAGYGGEKGFIQRVVGDFTVNAVASQTAGLVVLHPQTGLASTVTVAASGTAFAFALANFSLNPATPGGGFLAGVAEKTRAYASCISVFPAAVSLTNITGEFAMGVMSMDTLFSATQSVDNVFTLLTIRGAIQKVQTDIKWFPGTMDDRYALWNAPLQVDTSDTNVIVLAYRGYPAGLALSCRTTSVVEWTARSAGGLSVTDTTRPALPVANIVAAMHKKYPRWLRNIGDAAGAAASAVGTALFKSVEQRGPGLVQNMSARGFDMVGSSI